MASSVSGEGAVRGTELVGTEISPLPLAISISIEPCRVFLWDSWVGVGGDEPEGNSSAVDVPQRTWRLRKNLFFHLHIFRELSTLP